MLFIRMGLITLNILNINFSLFLHKDITIWKGNVSPAAHPTINRILTLVVCQRGLTFVKFVRL